MPKHTPTRDHARPDLASPPADDTEAIAWAILQKPDGWDPGEWLTRLMPDGIWSDMEPRDLADGIVDAAVRGRSEPAPDA